MFGAGLFVVLRRIPVLETRIPGASKTRSLEERIEGMMMKRLMVLVLACIVITHIAAGGADDNLIVPGMRIGWMKLGVNFDNYVKSLGAGKYEVMNECFLFCSFERYQVFFLIDREKHHILEIISSNPIHKTDKGIGIGSPYSEVAGAYGKPDSIREIEGAYLVEYRYRKLSFWLDKSTEKVKSVTVFAGDYMKNYEPKIGVYSKKYVSRDTGFIRAEVYAKNTGKRTATGTTVHFYTYAGTRLIKTDDVYFGDLAPGEEKYSTVFTMLRPSEGVISAMSDEIICERYDERIKFKYAVDFGVKQ